MENRGIIAMIQHGLGVTVMPEMVLDSLESNVITKELAPCEYRHMGIIVKSIHTASLAAKTFISHSKRIISELGTYPPIDGELTHKNSLRYCRLSLFDKKSIILLAHLEVAPGMVAYGAYLGSGLTHYYVAAVTALPHALSRFFKYSVHFDVVKQGAIALLMGLLFFQPHGTSASSLKPSSSALAAYRTCRSICNFRPLQPP